MAKTLRNYSPKVWPVFIRKGNSWDNAVESFFASLKKERIQLTDYRTRQEATYWTTYPCFITATGYIQHLTMYAQMIMRNN